MKKIVVVILAIAFMAVFPACHTQHDCPNYSQIETEQDKA